MFATELKVKPTKIPQKPIKRCSDPENDNSSKFTIFGDDFNVLELKQLTEVSRAIEESIRLSYDYIIVSAQDYITLPSNTMTPYRIIRDDVITLRTR